MNKFALIEFKYPDVSLADILELDELDTIYRIDYPELHAEALINDDTTNVYIISPVHMILLREMGEDDGVHFEACLFKKEKCKLWKLTECILGKSKQHPKLKIPEIKIKGAKLLSEGWDDIY